MQFCLLQCPQWSNDRKCFCASRVHVPSLALIHQSIAEL
uniref:Uncharacterized protein n=1 Tax=Anguilla anguilla TaxID=7936 RepID=A0A0E9QUL9_ANGAN